MLIQGAIKHKATPNPGDTEKVEPDVIERGDETKDENNPGKD